jgi:lysophospholipase L1-like esterase
MEQLPYTLEFMHKFNLHKWLGLAIEDGELGAIARIYGVSRARLARIERGFQENVARLASSLPKREEKPLPSPLTILAVGDSLTSDRESWVRILNRYWREEPNRRVLDCAVSAETSSDLLDRFYSTVAIREFDWVVLFIGTNDCRQLDDPAQISMISLEEYRRNVDYLTGWFLQKGKRIVLVTLPPVDNSRLRAYFSDENSCYDPARLEATNRYLRELAPRKGFVVADLAAAIQAQGLEVLGEDGLHLNGAGQTALCRLLLELLP